MRLTFDADVEEFRAEFVAFLTEHLPTEAEATERSRSSAHVPDWARRWQRLLFNNGWLLPGNPPEFGGRNATLLPGNARIEGLAWVNSGARISGNVVVKDNAIVQGGANLTGNAVVGGDAELAIACSAGTYLMFNPDRGCDGRGGETDINPPHRTFTDAELAVTGAAGPAR